MGTGLDHAFIMNFDKLICVICVMISVNIIHGRLYMEH